MPLVFVSRSKNIGDSLIESIAMALPEIVAEHLGQPNHPVFALSPNEVEVRVQNSPFNVLNSDLEVVVLALKLDERIKTGLLRTEAIALDLKAKLPNKITGFVWVTLVDGFFAPL